MPTLYTRRARERAASSLLARLADLARKAERLLVTAARRGDVAAGAQWFRIAARLSERLRAVLAWVAMGRA